MDRFEGGMRRSTGSAVTRSQDQSLGQVGVKSNSRRVKWAFSQNVKTIHTTQAPIWPLDIKSISNSIKSDKGCEEVRGWGRAQLQWLWEACSLLCSALAASSRLAAFVQTKTAWQCGQSGDKQFLLWWQSFPPVASKPPPNLVSCYGAASMK